MFGIVGYSSFVISTIILNLTPGADTIYILSRSAVGGRKKGMVSALGISTGILIHTILAALGLSLILANSAFLFNLLKMAGAAYLVAMGVKTIMAQESLVSRDAAGNQKSETLFKTYRQGVLTNVLNPKVAIFFLALLPQFVSADNAFGPLPFLLLGVTIFATSTIWTLFLAYISSFVSKILNSSDKMSTAATTASGLVYIGLGLNVLRAKMQ